MTAPAGGMRASRLVTVSAGLAVGATAWVSYGVVALLDADRTTRLLALPSWTLLAVLMIAGAGVASLLPPPRSALAPLSLLVLPWLPWLPFRVPAAFLLWDGPLEALVWAVALGGATQAWWSARHITGGAAADRWWQSDRRAPYVAAVLLVVVATGSWAIVRSRVPAGDEPHYLVITQSLLRDGDLRIENNHREHQYLDYFGGGLRPDFMRRGVDREIYSIHAPGASAVVLPGFALAGYPGAVMSVIGLVAVGLAMLWRTAHRLTADPGAAWVATLALLVSAPYLLMAFMVYPDPVGSVVVIVGLAALARLESGAALTPMRWVVTGAVLALLPWLHTRFAVLAGSFGLVLALRAFKGRHGVADVLRLLAVPTVSAASWFAYFYVIYGRPDPGAPYGPGTGSGGALVPTGLAGLLIDQQFGLIANAPILGVGVAGLIGLVRQRPRLALELLAIAVPYLVTAAAFPMWWGGFSSPARFAVVTAPLFALPIATLWTRASATVRAAIGVTLVTSAALTAAMVAVDRGAFVFNGRDGHALVLDWLSASTDLTLALPSVHRDGAAGALVDAAVWVAAAGLALVLTAQMARRRAVGPGRWLAAPLVVMAAATAVWARVPRPSLTPAESQRRLLDAWRDGALPVVAQVAPRRPLAVGDVAGRLTLNTSTRGARSSDGAPLLQVSAVPAGDYDVFIDAPGTPAGTATVVLGRQGRTALPMEQWTFDGRRAGYSGLVLRLPVDAHSITVSGDAAARQTIRTVALRPRHLTPAAGRVAALRAVRYGAVVVFALDDTAYLEPGAFWVRGQTASSMVVRGDGGATGRIRLRAGPVATGVRLTAGAWRRDVALTPGENVDVDLPEEALAPAVLTITTTAGFQPSAHGGGDDVRWLGVYATWPGPDSAAPGAMR